MKTVKFVAYGAMVASKSPQHINQTKLYKTLKQFYVDDIFIDAIHSISAERTELNNLIYGKEAKLKKDDVLMLDSLKSLAPKKEISSVWHEIVFNLGINIMVPLSPELNTCDYNGVRISTDALRTIMNMVDRFSPRKGKGRIPIEITDTFLKAYWDYQNYKLTPEEASEQAEIGKKTFYRLLDMYERTPDYKDELNKQPCAIENLPKRGGKLPDNFTKVLWDVEKLNISIDDACKKHGIEYITPREYKRYKKRHDLGRKKTTAMDDILSKDKT